MRAAVARAADGPASTLVIDGAGLIHLSDDRMAAAAAIEPTRQRAMVALPDLGAKTIVVFPADAGQFRLLFFQGLPDGSVDTAIEVCVNSAACALTVARHCWGMAPDGSLAARMGNQVFGFEEVVA